MALWRRGGKRTESLKLRLLNLTIWIEKVDERCWLVEMTLVMTSLPLGTCFSMFVYTRARFRFVLIGGNLTAQLTKRDRGIEVRIQSPETLLQALLPFLARPPEGIGELARRLDMENRAAHPQLRIHRKSSPG